MISGKNWVLLIYIFMFCLDVFLTHRRRKMIKSSKCPKCGCTVTKDDFYHAVATHKQCGYCPSCGKMRRLMDRIFWVVFILIVCFLSAVYIVCSQ